MSEVTTLGFSDEARKIIDVNQWQGPFTVQNAEVFLELGHLFKFAIAIAIKKNGITPDSEFSPKTTWSVNTIDEDRAIYNIVRCIYLKDFGEQDITNVYRTAGRLADWGIKELQRQNDVFSDGTINFDDLDLSKVE